MKPNLPEIEAHKAASSWPSDTQALLTYCRELEAETLAKSRALEAKDVALKDAIGWMEFIEGKNVPWRVSVDFMQATLSQTWEQFLEPAPTIKPEPKEK